MEFINPTPGILLTLVPSYGLNQNQIDMEFLKYIPGLLMVLIVLGFIVFKWVEGIDYMSKNHPDYTGNDLFGEWDENDKNQIG